MSRVSCFALLRGINVGRHKRIPMAELRQLLESLGCTRVKTLLNSGNAVFDAPGDGPEQWGPTLEAAIQESFGFRIAVVAGGLQCLDRVIDANPLPHATRSPSRLLVAFPISENVLHRAEPLVGKAWDGEEISLAAGVAYIHCVRGIAASRLLQAFNRMLGESVTARNWATVLRLRALKKS